jgi:predicted O-linked N-acetylglucosamine transferase (SPINDLY family)
LSPDFRDHPVSQLVAGVIESHDRSRFETYAISAGPDDGSRMRRRIETAFDHFHDVSAMSDLAVAEQLANLSIDIAVDLGGHTMGSRTQILAHRPAPVQVSFLGFPGTLGARFIDYIIADRNVIPEADQVHYSEKVIYMPDTYLPGALASPLDPLPERNAAGLPATGVIFCCFNAPHKISPRIFDIWMHILKAVPDSIAWLRDAPAVVKKNLAMEAERRGVSSARLRYATKVPTLADHCSRLALADIFLDTYPYGAHTTASDALGAGVPIVTRRGSTFSSRVATSLLSSCELGYLSVDTATEYEGMAVRLAQAPRELADLKAHLRTMRSAAPLFKTRRFCRHLEAAYAEIWARYERGEGPSFVSLRARAPDTDE